MAWFLGEQYTAEIYGVTHNIGSLNQKQSEASLLCTDQVKLSFNKSEDEENVAHFYLPTNVFDDQIKNFKLNTKHIKLKTQSNVYTEKVPVFVDSKAETDKNILQEPLQELIVWKGLNKKLKEVETKLFLLARQTKKLKAAFVDEIVCQSYTDVLKMD